MNENLSTPLNIASVRVRGAVRTRDSFLGSIIDPVLERQDEDSPTLGTVLQKTKEIKSLLEETDLFSQVEAVIDRSRGPLAHPDDVDVVFLTREKGRYFLNTSTQVGNNEGGAVRVYSSSQIGAETLGILGTCSYSLGTGEEYGKCTSPCELFAMFMTRHRMRELDDGSRKRIIPVVTCV